MNIKTINNFNNRYSMGRRKEVKLMPSKEERTRKLLDKTLEAMAQDVKDRVPEKGKFGRTYVYFDIPETSNSAMLYVEPNPIQPVESRILSVGVHHQQRDRLISNDLLEGSNKDIIGYLEDERNQSPTQDIIKKLSQKTDDYYSSL